ncbi:unnamed protein product [Mesocestoides corti]|uniref:Uncharacterized protein n=1 Tax=Mesocestoides corti TaxID=53468 RepID=A0A0R3URD3_MESCO|nr:unnamed protein product [Mesocestoides corti]
MQNRSFSVQLPLKQPFNNEGGKTAWTRSLMHQCGCGYDALENAEDQLCVFRVHVFHCASLVAGHLLLSVHVLLVSRGVRVRWVRSASSSPAVVKRRRNSPTQSPPPPVAANGHAPPHRARPNNGRPPTERPCSPSGRRLAAEWAHLKYLVGTVGCHCLVALSLCLLHSLRLSYVDCLLHALRLAQDEAAGARRRGGGCKSSVKKTTSLVGEAPAAAAEDADGVWLSLQLRFVLLLLFCSLLCVEQWITSASLAKAVISE